MTKQFLVQVEIPEETRLTEDEWKICVCLQAYAAYVFTMATEGPLPVPELFVPGEAGHVRVESWRKCSPPTGQTVQTVPTGFTMPAIENPPLT